MSEKQTMQLMRHLPLFIICAMLGCATGKSVDAADPEKKTISAVVYNVQFLPGPAGIANKRKLPFYRAERLGQELSKFDIVALNETFDVRPREIILEQLEQAWGDRYHAEIHPKPDDSRANGGLLIASRFPIIQSNSMYFSHFSTPEEYGLTADGHAAKGVLHVRIALNEDTPSNAIDVFTTHLEARDAKYREKQYPEMSEFISKHAHPTLPSIIMGDMNTRGHPPYPSDPNSQYHRMMKYLNEGRFGEGSVLDLWPTVMGSESHGGTSDQESIEKGRRIDYIFLSNPLDSGARLEPIDIRIDAYPDEKVKFLSDHNAVIARFNWLSPQ